MRFRWAVAAAGVCLLVASTRAAGAALPPCAPADLGIHFVDESQGLGHSLTTFAFVNVTARRCTLRGYPGMAAYSASGRRIALQVKRGGMGQRGGLQRVTLRPRGRAYFVVDTTHQSSTCPRATRLRFTPPDGRSTVQIRHGLTICGRYAAVSSVRRTARG